MQNGGRDWYSNVNDVTSSHPELANEILGEIRERGPLASRHFEGAAGGGMWNWKPAKAMLERLWNHGELVIAGRQGFQRVYDLTERVIPRAQLEAPVPSDARGAADARRAGGAGARRADRVRASKEHWRLTGGIARIRPALDELVAEGRLRRLRVDDGGATSWSPPTPSSTGRRRAPPSCSRRSTTCSGTGRSRAGSSASTT